MSDDLEIMETAVKNNKQEWCRRPVAVYIKKQTGKPWVCSIGVVLISFICLLACRPPFAVDADNEKPFVQRVLWPRVGIFCLVVFIVVFLVLNFFSRQ